MASTNHPADQQEVLQRTSVELDLSDLDLNMLAELEGTALGLVLQELQDMKEEQPGSRQFTSHTQFHAALPRIK